MITAALKKPMDTAMAQVTSYAMSDMFYLPPGTIPPMVMPFDPTASVPLTLWQVENLGFGNRALRQRAGSERREACLQQWVRTCSS